MSLDFIGEDFMTLRCTYWLKTGHDDWTGQDTYSTPVVARCWYKKDFKLIRNDRGEEVASSATYLSDELTLVTNNSYIAFGESAALDPIAAGASVVNSHRFLPGCRATSPRATLTAPLFFTEVAHTSVPFMVRRTWRSWTKFTVKRTRASNGV